MSSELTNQVEQIIGEVRLLSIILTSTEHHENIDVSHYDNITSLLLYLIETIHSKAINVSEIDTNNIYSNKSLLDILLGYIEKTMSYLTLVSNVELSRVDLESHSTLISRLSLGIEDSFNEWSNI